MSAIAAPGAAPQERGRGPGRRQRVRAPEFRMARIVSFRPWHYWGGTVAWMLYFVFPLLPGWLVGRLFSELRRCHPILRLDCCLR